MPNNDFPKAYEPQAHEDDIYTTWEASGFFNPDNLPGKRSESFSIVLPPPNVTGVLHLGHAVMLAIEDIMTRFERLRGKKALWLPGTDHAAIATQAKVEKLLIAEGVKDPRHKLGREVFLKHVEDFATKSHNTIVSQARKMGASLDWSREAFTLDKARGKAVKEAFKRMYADELIYQGDRIVNWCPRCKSTLSDDELSHKETIAKLYTFKYSKDFPISISTTRPETKLGDSGVAVGIEDNRYKDFVGKEIEVTFAGGPLKLKIVADEAVEAEFGTGALGVTPAHSKIDEEIAKRHNLPFISVIGENGLMTSAAGEGFIGLSVKEARAKVITWLEKNNLMESVTEAPQNLSVCYRCGAVVEPLPKKQWWIAVNKSFKFKQSDRAPINGLKDGQEITLKKLMQHVVQTEQVHIVPKRFEKTYFNWIDNLHDWNISRQIWYGHRVPVWRQGNEVVVGEKPEGDNWVQDEDTLDTWFSSGLWTFSTLGWPDEKAKDLNTFHPTSVLETGYDIIFFWVARMILMTTYLLGEVPFRDVYLHGLVRDEQGRKMSKSLGNAIDPLDMISEFGADATRLALVIGTSAGNDSKLSKAKIAGYRNFANKLWNISRFVFGVVEKVEEIEKVEAKTLADKWILGRFSEVIEKVTTNLDQYEYSAAGETLRDFTWNEFADWYLEIAKIQLGHDDLKDSTEAILNHILERVLILWHPFMPFVTEEIWQRRGHKDLLIVAEWPKVEHMLSEEITHEFGQIQEVIVAIRNIRNVYRLKPKQELEAVLVASDLHQLYDEQAEIISVLAGVAPYKTKLINEKPEGAATAVLTTVTVYVSLVGLVDLEKEKARLEKDLQNTTNYIERQKKQLANKAFTSKAPAQIIDGMQIKLDEAEKSVVTLKEQIDNL